MEILFRNLRGTRKLCMETPAAEINGIPQRDYLAIKELVERNPGYTWEPVRSGYAASNNVPLIPSYQMEGSEMTFDEYYDGERKSLREILEKRPWLTALNFLVSPGRKLTAEDCELFWSLLKDAQEDAFAAGREPGGHVAEPELACRTEKSPPEPVLEPGEYTIGQLMELSGKGMSTVRQWIYKHPVQQRKLPQKDPSSPRVAYTLTDEDISDLRELSVRNRGKKNPGKNPGGVADDDRGRGLDGEGCDGARGPSVGCAGFGDDNLRHEWASVEDASRETGITPALIKWSSRQGRTVEGWNFTVYE